MKRFNKLFVALTALPIIGFAAPVFAGSPGQLAQGDKLYMVKINGNYSKSVSASCNDEVTYSMQLSNTGFSELTNVTLTANLPTNGGTSTATATTDQGASSGTHDSATVNLNSGSTQSLESGTTVLYNDSGSAIKTLPDNITSGLNVGTINGSTTEYVNFKVKINCPQPPVSSFACTELGVVQIDRTRYDFTAKSSVSNATVTSYVFTVKNASGTTIDTNTVTTNATSAVYHFNQPTGTYKVNAVVHTDKGSTKASECEKQITVASTPPTTPPSTPPATTLPNTGAGDVLGIFAGASAAGTAAHAIVSRRRR